MLSKTATQLKSALSNRRNLSGQTLSEYALIIAFISIVAIATLESLGFHVTSIFR